MAGGAVFGIPVARGPREQVVAAILGLARGPRPGYVVFADTNVMMEAAERPGFHKIVAEAALVVADGTPVWMEARRGATDVGRHPGPDVVPLLLDQAAAQGLTVGFLGLDADRQARLKANVQQRWPRLQVALTLDPGHGEAARLVTPELRQAIAASAPDLLFVGLGCPKQETVMALLAPTSSSLMLGVGQALDVLAGSVARAPRWMSRVGLEWLFRLGRQPRRLAGRYARAARFPLAVRAWTRRSRLRRARPRP
jgi:N-acetylglucosaminyldiphosphoundecaprenol N-acetyl-beta-D-mannosaminyltransferase